MGLRVPGFLYPGPLPCTVFQNVSQIMMPLKLPFNLLWVFLSQHDVPPPHMVSER